MSQHNHTDHQHHRHDSGNIGIAFGLNVTFTILEIIGGLYTNSSAILADAIHDLGDSLSLGMAYFLERYAQKHPDTTYSFGYKRFSLLSGLLIALTLVFGGLIVLNHSIPRLLNPEVVDTQGVLLLAIAGVVFNFIGYQRTHASEQVNSQVISLHLLEDILGWVAVGIMSVVVEVTDWYILDPLLAISINVYIMYKAFGSIRKIMKIFLQGIPTDVNSQDLIQDIKAIAGVVSIHDFHAWTLDGHSHIGSIHIHTDTTDKITHQALLQQVQKTFRKYHIHHVTVQVEGGDNYCEHCSSVI